MFDTFAGGPSLVSHRVQTPLRQQVNHCSITTMFSLLKLTTALSFAYTFLAQVHASPLSRRDVIAPQITSPDSSSVWPIGSTQLVTWDTSDFPPDSQITNPIGQIILGFNESNSLNLDLAHPLAQGFKLRDGQVQITVPNVPPRTDYLIVLFGDSGDTSPTFAITTISAGTALVDTSSTLSTSTGSATTGGTSESTQSTSTSSTGTSTAPVPTSTTPGTSSSSSSSSPSSASSASGSAAAASASTKGTSSAAWSVHSSGCGFKTLSWGVASTVVLALFL